MILTQWMLKKQSGKEESKQIIQEIKRRGCSNAPIFDPLPLPAYNLVNFWPPWACWHWCWGSKVARRRADQPQWWLWGSQVGRFGSQQGVPEVNKREEEWRYVGFTVTWRVPSESIPSLQHWTTLLSVTHTWLSTAKLLLCYRSLMYYSLISVVGNGENEIDDQQTSDAILSINYRDKVG